MAIPFDPAAAGQALQQVLAETTKGTVEAVRSVVGDADARASRLAAIADQLAAAVGKEDARVVELRRSSDLSRAFAEGLKRFASKIPPDGVPPPQGFTFTGRVTDATGAAVPGVHVRLTDRAGTVRVPGSAVTDEFGGFLLVVPPDAVDPNTELSLVAEDANGRLSTLTPGPVQLQPGVLQRVDVIFATPPAPRADTTSSPADARSRRRKPRRKQV